MKRRIEIIVCLAFVLTVFISMTGFAQSCETLRGEVLRLHILANSNSDGDQALKLLVRDRLLKEEIFTQSPNKEEALEKARQSTEKLTRIAKDELVRNGCADEVTVEIVNMYFTTREYETFTLPAGQYDAVRVLIGEGKGNNWWCVMFPPLCLPAATDKSAIDDAFTDKETAIMTQKPKYKAKFKVVELFEKAKAKK